MEKIVIFGAGNCGRLIASKLLYNAEILGFIDNDPLKSGTFVEIEGDSSRTQSSNSSSGNHSADLADFEGSQTISLASPPKSAKTSDSEVSCKNHESNTANTRIVLESSANSAQDLKSNADSAIDSPSLAEGARGWVKTQNNIESNSSLRESETTEAIHNKNMDCHADKSARNDETVQDSSESNAQGEKSISFFAIKSNGREAQTLKASSGWGITKETAAAPCFAKDFASANSCECEARSKIQALPLSQKEKSENLETRKAQISDSVEMANYGDFSLNTECAMGGGGRNEHIRRFQIFPRDKLMQLDFDRVIVGTFTGYHEIKAQLENLGIAREKIDVSHIELSVYAREQFLSDFALESYRHQLRGNVAELGVYRGDFARLINESFYDRRLYLFDTFEGFSSADLSNQKDGAMGSNLGQRHFSNTSVELVLSKMPYPKQCVIKKGWFPQSAEGLDNERFCFVNLDADLYEPILAGLRFFYPKMCAGGIILIHEYFSAGYVGVREAVNEFCARAGIKVSQRVPIGDNLSIAIIKH